MQRKQITNVPIRRQPGNNLMNQIGRLVQQNLTRGGISRLPSVYESNLLLVNGTYVGQADNTSNYIDNAFLVNSTVYSVVTYIARKFASIPVGVYRKTRDQKAFREYKYYIDNGQHHKALQLQKKALEPAEDTELAKILLRPNPLQGTSAFFENLIGFKLITGAGTAWANRPVPGGKPAEFWCLPSDDIVIIVEDEQYLVPSGYQLQTNYVVNLRKEDILYWKYFNPQWTTTGSHLYGLAPLRAGILTLQENQNAKNASNSLLYNQGAKGIVYNKGAQDMPIDERDGLKRRFNEFVNGRENLGRVEVANTDLGYINLGMNSLDMGITGPNSIRSVSKEDICNIFHFPAVLLSQDTSAYNNYETAIKALMMNTIVPEWCSLRDDFNAWVKPMYPGQDLWIEPDFSVVAELQKDLNKLSEVPSRIWAMTPNQQLEFMGMTDYMEPENQSMNKRYIPQNMMLLDDVANGPQDLTDDINNLDEQGLL